MSNVSNLRCPLTPRLPAFVISAGLVFCEPKEWNDRSAVKRAVNQHQPSEWSKTNQPTKTDRPTNQRKQITKHPTKQPLSSPTSKYRNQLLKQNEPTNVLGINILLVHHFRIKQSVINTTRTTRTPAFWGYPPPPHDYPHYWIPSQKNNRSRTENVTEQTRFSKSRSNDLEDIGQGQRSSHATHLLMLVIICTKYGKNPSRTVDATERTRFSRSRPNDLEDIGQGQRSSCATHLLMLVIICTIYGKNPSRTVDATERTRFSRSRPNDLKI